MRCMIVPPYLLARLSRLDATSLETVATAAHETLMHTQPLRAARQTAMLRPAHPTQAGHGPRRTISDAGGREVLPGTVVRREGGAPTADPAVDEAYDGLGATYALFADAFGRASIDDRGLGLDATVHYGARYDNAFWDGERMVFGDGDGEIFRRFTLSLSVIGHELSHGVTQYSNPLEYSGQSGALNESVSDVFGALVEQYARRQTVAEANWLIGAELFTEMVEGAALRSMKAPGTAYDDDILGVDPQPAHMRDFVETSDDNGGVHINSGIPNRAFYLVADSLGGFAWHRAGQIWYDTITGGALAPTATFADFARATAGAARSRFGGGSSELDAVERAWSSVGVRP
ncbi:Thermolysin metallopeptidase, catalytic domain [Agreia bicolorata]|uniref:Neutral metalloproteinase n=1 Tax=Agreia bicolorata TaxID=110935 RepID=A0A1T4XBB6_9MICO|nr:M4 family metallopeptidase [Agreia bicolorata]KJC65565.1 peptidase M4 [Agreia bicolorata]SKA86846.1 Thermolysin metallopeptidase, catalytic domain [Agreia bicolorata]